MMNVLLLFPEEMEADTVQSVGTQFVVANENEEQIEDDSSFNVDRLIFSPTHLFAL